MAGADRHTVVIEQRTDVMRMHAIEREGQNRGLFLGGADQAHAGNRLQLVRGVVEQRMLVGRDGIKAKGFDGGKPAGKPFKKK